MQVSIIIVSWNVKDLLQKCVESIQQYSSNISYEIIVVDNASTDGTAEMIQQFPEVTYIQNNTNAGFAKANNQGITQAQGEYILLLNPDTEFTENTIEQCIGRFDGTVGVIGCQLHNPDGSIQLSVRRFPTFLSQLAILFKIHKIFPFVLHNYLAKDFDYTKEAEVDQVMGAFMCIPKKVLDTVGLLDEDFFIWFEEVDLCRRIKQAGFTILYYPDTSIIHHGGTSFAQQMTLKKQWWFFRSALRYFLK